MSNEDKFIEENKDQIYEIIKMSQKVTEIQDEYRKLREDLCRKMNKSDLNIIRIPEMNARIHINGGIGSSRLDRRKLEKKYPKVFYDCIIINHSDPYVIICPIDKNIKKGVNLFEVKNEV